MAWLEDGLPVSEAVVWLEDGLPVSEAVEDGLLVSWTAAN